MYLLGQFRDKDAVAAAIRALRAEGIGAAELDLFSDEPVELPAGVLDRPSRMSLASVAGAVAFGALATLFVRYTQHQYKVITGGMPLFSFWATGVITYEMTMLGSIVATFAWFLWESGLVRKRGKPAPVPDVEPGTMCLRVTCRVEQAPTAVEAMRRAGAAQVDRRSEE